MNKTYKQCNNLKHKNDTFFCKKNNNTIHTNNFKDSKQNGLITHNVQKINNIYRNI